MTHRSQICLAFTFAVLFLSTCVLYWQTRNYDFVNYDDASYIYYNEHVTNGLNRASFYWAITEGHTGEMGNWHPLTTLSWLMDVSLFGLSPGRMHLHNACMHAINACLLLYIVLLLLVPFSTQITDGKRLAIAFLVTVVWAWHPLRMESVAWISSRKDVLFLFWLLLGLINYCHYLVRDKKYYFLFVVGCFLMAFMSKPIAVVFPLLAISLEIYLKKKISWVSSGWLIYLSLCMCGLVYIVQDNAGATVMNLPLSLRIENAIGSLGHYIQKTIWPTHLSVFYKYEIPVSRIRTVIGCVFIIASLGFVWDTLMGQIKSDRRSKPISSYHALIVLGLFIFYVSLLPVIGLIQVGFASCADRYTYLPSIGLSLCLGALFVFIVKWSIKFHVLSISTFLCAIVLFMSTNAQLKYWTNSQTLFAHAASVTDQNYQACSNEGLYYMSKKDYEHAFLCFLDSVKFIHAELERKRIMTPYKDSMMTSLIIAFSALHGGEIEKTATGTLLKEDIVLKTEIDKNDTMGDKKYFAKGLYAYHTNLDNLAIQFFKQAIDLNNQDKYYWQFLGYTLERIGYYEDADHAYTMSLGIKADKNICDRRKLLKVKMEKTF